MKYWNQKATPWVSFAVLAGGFLSTMILFWIVKIEAEFSLTISNY